MPRTAPAQLDVLLSAATEELPDVTTFKVTGQHRSLLTTMSWKLIPEGRVFTGEDWGGWDPA